MLRVSIRKLSKNIKKEEHHIGKQQHTKNGRWTKLCVHVEALSELFPLSDSPILFLKIHN